MGFPMARANLPYLTVQRGRYFYRRRIPLAAQHELGEWLKRPLHTDSYVVAAERWRPVHDEVEAAIKAVVRPETVVREIDDVKDELIRPLLEGQQLAWIGTRRPTMVEMAAGDASPAAPPRADAADWFDAAIRNIEARHRWKMTDGLKDRLRERYAYMADTVDNPVFKGRGSQNTVNEVLQAHTSKRRPAADGAVPLSPPTTRRRAVTLASLIERFSGDATRAELRPTTKANYTAPFDVLKDVLGADTDIRTVSRDDLKRYRDILTWLPVNARRMDGFAAMSFADIAAVTKELHE